MVALLVVLWSVHVGLFSSTAQSMPPTRSSGRHFASPVASGRNVFAKFWPEGENKTRRESDVQSDCKHQAAPDRHGMRTKREHVALDDVRADI